MAARCALSGSRAGAFLAALASSLACAPLSSFRPASGLLPDRGVEMGAGATVVSPRPHVLEPVRAGGQAWTTVEPGARLGLSLIGSFDDDAIGVGVALRVALRRTETFAAAVEGELGLGWAALSAPLALRMFDESWAYAAPRFGTWGIDPLLALPLGASFRVHDGLFVRAESQGALHGFSFDNRRFLAGAAVAYQR